MTSAPQERLDRSVMPAAIAAAQLKYRPDVDGLRAVAVVAVLLYHLGFALIPGGFVGVDIFFVISGYLITDIVSKKLQERSFSLADFFVRRIRRLFPAMFAVVSLTLVGGFFLLPPPDLARLGASSVSAIFSVSNIYFWSGTGYFDTDAMTKPLLHTWSLGVEEQFYLIWPLLLIATLRWFGGRFALIIAATGIISFAACQFILSTSQESSFFWMPLRAYEFAVGGFLAAIKLRLTSRLFANILFTLGVMLIAYSFAYFNHSTVFPRLVSHGPLRGDCSTDPDCSPIVLQ